MTNLKNIISTTEARRRIFELTADVQKPDRYYTLTENGRAKAVLLSIDEYESMVETLDVLRENPHALKDIAQSQAEFEAGDYKIWQPKKAKTYTQPVQNYAVAEKGAKYVPGRAPKKGSKATK